MGERRRAGLAVLAALLAGCAAGGDGARAEAALAIPINLKCTTCDDFIRCAADGVVADAATGRAPHTVYRLREKTFWAQVATIKDYLLQAVVEKTTDQRPYSVYRDNGRTRVMEHDPQARAQIDARAGKIAVAGLSIDQRDGAWINAQGVRIGQCVAMPRRQGYAMVRDLLGEDATRSAAAWPEFQKPAECQ